jgi:glutamyl-tRNA synthetase
MSPFGQQLRDFVRDAGPGCRLRLAPTPSGFLHAGNALNFIFNWITARCNGGSLILRIDDLDADRKRPEFVQDVFDSLEWLGIDWDLGPESVPDFEQNWSQHRRLPLYTAQLEKLRSTGLLFACRKSRSDLAPFQGKYPVEFREQGLSLDDTDVAWRIQTPPGFSMPDFVVRRRDSLPAYQVASLTDGVHFGITHAVRGIDLEPSTQAQKFLAACLQEDSFLKIKFLHHPLILDASGEKLSKSAGASSLQAMHSAGEPPATVFRQGAQVLGFSELQVKTVQNLLNFFHS